MKVFYYTGFTGRYPVGTAAVVVAEDKELAIQLLENRLIGMKLTQALKPEKMIEIPTSVRSTHILCDGDY